MRAVVQRVLRASVSVEQKIVGSCSQGWFILLGVKHTDSEKDVVVLSKKIVALRAFSDENDKMNLDIRAIKGSILVVSQFTLYGDLTRGNRPGFANAAKPEQAIILYERFVKSLQSEGIPVETGVFGANMQIQTHCDGPVTFILET